MQRPKQRTKFSLTPMMDFRSKIREIVDRTHCKRHNKRIGQPCWWVRSDSLVLHAGICGARVSQVYDGKITDSSLSNKRPKKEHA